MRFKLDENFGSRTRNIISAAGHDVETVLNENLQGASDKHLYDICCEERRCLITLDLDFSDVVRFFPDKCSGIAVIRLARNPSLPLLEKLIRQMLHSVDLMKLEGELWIIEAGRIRVHQQEKD